MRRLVFALALACAPPAAAQAPAEDIARVSRLLAANWRPLGPDAASAPRAAFAAACAGAVEEMETLDAALPAELTPEALAPIRPPTGFIIVATDQPERIFLFPNPALNWIASGEAVITAADAASGIVRLRDAAEREAELQLGISGAQAMLRLTAPGGALRLYVGCAPTAR